MQTFKDTQSGQLYAFDDDVKVINENGVYSFESAGGTPLSSIPTTLQPYTVPEPTDAELLSAAQADQISALSAACAAAIVSGFTSNALGSDHTYPSALTDQQNQSTVANCAAGGKLWCRAGDAWDFVSHSQAQAQGVVSSFGSWLNTCQSQLVALADQVNAATTVSAVQAITWPEQAAADTTTSKSA